MPFKYLLEKPTERILKYLALFGILLTIIMMIVVIGLLDSANYSGTLEETQLGFNGAYIKSQFMLMGNHEMLLFILGNAFDYFFMLGYGISFFSIALLLTRKLREGSIWSKIGYCIAILGIVSACCDAIENVFLLLMASNPAGFPTWLGIPHSCFAFTKFTLMYSVFGWITITTLSKLMVKTWRKYSHLITES